MVAVCATSPALHPSVISPDPIIASFCDSSNVLEADICACLVRLMSAVLPPSVIFPLIVSPGGTNVALALPNPLETMVCARASWVTVIE
jgi:hypothetical protein